MIVGVQSLVMKGLISRHETLTVLAGLIVGTAVVGYLMELTLGGNRAFIPHFAYVPYFWAFLMCGLFFAFMHSSKELERAKNHQPKVKTSIIKHSYKKDPEGCVYRLDYEEDGTPAAAWRQSADNEWIPITGAGLVGLFTSRGELEVIAESESVKTL